MVFPDGKSENLGNSEGKRVMTDGQAYEVTKILKMNVQREPARLPTTAARRPARPARPTRPRTPGSLGYTPQLSAAVWVGYPDAGVAMPGAQGGTYAAPVWHAFMLPAHGEYCEDFPLPEEPFVSSPFFGKYASTGSAGTGGYYDQDADPSTDDTTGGTDPVRPALLRDRAAGRARRPSAGAGAHRDTRGRRWAAA